MHKQAFLEQLRKSLSGLPQSEIEERLTFYSEMIDDRMEEGASEEDAVAACGVVGGIAVPFPVSAVPTPKNAVHRRLRAWEIVLLTLGAPIWLSLGIAALAVVFSLYVSLWAVIVSLWAVFVSLAACAVGCTATCAVFCAGGNVPSGVAVLAAGLVCAGLAVFAFYGCAAATKGTALLTEKATVYIKNKITGRAV